MRSIFYVVRPGCQWRLFLSDFPPWQIMYVVDPQGLGLTLLGEYGVAKRTTMREDDREGYRQWRDWTAMSGATK